MLHFGRRLARMSSKFQSSVLTGSGDDGEDLPTTDFGESLDLKQPGARATEQPLTQTGEVQLERQVSNSRQRVQFHCHDDVAIRTVAEKYDKRLVPHTQK
ncbi:uncharacterized protein LOC142560456 isoform X2 [Dermacentor variabilis]|uniref:uncharacterized protein LOC142560456 isoform X2 n=1 Tax=Dermacentor variabilis TaxID=34621 RepID=UPI003F5C6274